MSSVLDPVPLDNLARYLRDEVWLDMRVVDHGLLRRGRIFEIRVRRLEEEVAVEQEYVVDGETGVGRLEFEFDADAIRWAKPSSFELGDVPPPDLRTQEEKRRDAERAERARLDREWAQNALYAPPPWQLAKPYAGANSNYCSWNICDRLYKQHSTLQALRAAILAVLSKRSGFDVPTLLRASTKGVNWWRKWGIRMVWELTDVGQGDIPFLFGYHSGGMSTFALGDTGDCKNAQHLAREILKDIEQWMNQPWTARRSKPLSARSKQKKLLS